MSMSTVAAPVDADQLRLRHEFLVMPGLALTIAQAARLVGVRHDHAEHLLESLEDDGFLIRLPCGRYHRADVPSL